MRTRRTLCLKVQMIPLECDFAEVFAYRGEQWLSTEILVWARKRAREHERREHAQTRRLPRDLPTKREGIIGRAFPLKPPF